MICFGHRNEFPLVNTLVCTGIYWIRPTMFLMEFELLNNMWVASTSHVNFLYDVHKPHSDHALRPGTTNHATILRYWRPMRRMCDRWIKPSIGSEPTGRKASTNLPPQVPSLRMHNSKTMNNEHSNIPLDPTKKHCSEQRTRCSHYLAQSKGQTFMNFRSLQQNKHLRLWFLKQQIVL